MKNEINRTSQLPEDQQSHQFNSHSKNRKHQQFQQAPPRSIPVEIKKGLLEQHWLNLDRQNAAYFGYLSGACTCKNHCIHLDSKKQYESSYQLTYIAHPTNDKSASAQTAATVSRVSDMQFLFNLNKRHSPFHGRPRSSSPPRNTKHSKNDDSIINNNNNKNSFVQSRMSSAEITRRLSPVTESNNIDLNKRSLNTNRSPQSTQQQQQRFNVNQNSTLKVIRTPFDHTTSYKTNFRPRTAQPSRIKPVLPQNQMPNMREFPIPPNYTSEFKSNQLNLQSEIIKLKKAVAAVDFAIEPQTYSQTIRGEHAQQQQVKSDDQNQIVQKHPIEMSKSTSITTNATQLTQPQQQSSQQQQYQQLASIFKRKNDITQQNFVNFSEQSNIAVTSLGCTPAKMLIKSTSYQSSHSYNPLYVSKERVVSGNPSLSKAIYDQTRKFDSAIKKFAKIGFLETANNSAIDRAYQTTTQRFYSPQKRSSPDAAATTTIGGNMTTMIKQGSPACENQQKQNLIPKKFYNYTVPGCNHRDGVIYVPLTVPAVAAAAAASAAVTITDVAPTQPVIPTPTSTVDLARSPNPPANK